MFSVNHHLFDINHIPSLVWVITNPASTGAARCDEPARKKKRQSNFDVVINLLGDPHLPSSEAGRIIPGSGSEELEET